MSWQVQVAKQHFGEVLRAAEHDGPQTITRHGQEITVVISIDEYRRLTRRRRTSRNSCSVRRTSMTR